jgi:hypothetical protein
LNGLSFSSDRNGYQNKAVKFNVLPDIMCTNNLVSNPTEFTLSVWFKSSNSGRIFGFDDGQCSHIFSQDRYIDLMPNGQIRFHINHYSGNYFIYSGSGKNDNNWHLVICSFGQNGMKLYLDGNLESSNPNNLITAYNGYWRAGGLNTYTEGSILGSIDDIAIFNRELTQAEITALYQNTIKLNLTAFLEGSNLGNSSMTATLNKVNASISNSIADSIIVELHESTSPYATMYSSNGVLNTNGTATIAFPNSAIGSSYYIAIKHRNAIETWSAAPVTISNNTIYNFTTSASQAYGNNLSNMGDGVFGMYSGDINQDGSIDFSDYPDLDIANNSGVLGYNVNDLNGDASVDFNDYPLLDINSNNGIIAMRP